MRGKTFPRGGGDIPHRKGATDRKPIVVLPAPDQVVIPMQQHIGAPCEPIVKPGEYVKLGQKIGESKQFVSAPIHASVSGTVKAVEQRTLANGNKVVCVVIDNDHQDQLAAELAATNLESLSPEKIVERVKAAGIVGMGGAGFPTHIKLTPPKPVDTIIINGAECEPYLTCDHRLMAERTDELIYGLKAIMKAAGAKRGIIGIEVNKPDAILAVEKAIDGEATLQVVPLQVRYPQGAEKQLIKAATNREVPSGSLPSEVGCIVSNVHTAISISEAIQGGIPSYQRVVTLSGKCAVDPRNLLVRLGTPIQSLIDFCGGTYQEPAAVVAGGPMTGCAVEDLSAPITKTSSGILLLAADEIAQTEDNPCIRCAQCVDACPMGLTPNMLALLSERGLVKKAEQLNVMDCVECGICSYVCPSRRGLVTRIKDGKKQLLAQRAKEKAV